MYNDQAAPPSMPSNGFKTIRPQKIISENLVEYVAINWY
jgi:hypothetical protein